MTTVDGQTYTSLSANRDAARSVSIFIVNNTGGVLSNSAHSLSHGMWSECGKPDSSGLWVGAPVEWDCESNGIWTGVEGKITYETYDNTNGVANATFTMHFDNPWSGSNSYSIDVDGDQASQYKASYAGGGGDNATVVFTIEKS